MGLGGLRELVMDREAWHAALRGVAKSRARLSDSTELNVQDRILTFIGPGHFCFVLVDICCLKLNIQKTKIMASGPITSWQIDGETMEKVTDFILGGSKITADGDCSHEIKKLLLLARKVMTNLDSILKSRDVTLPTKVRLVKAVVFPVVMYGWKSWTMKPSAKE